MPEFSGTYACGHTGVVDIDGKNSEWWAKCEFKKLCPECYEKALQAQKQKEEEEVEKFIAERNFPALTSGTEKQIKWANSLRVEFTKIFDDWCDRRFFIGDDSKTVVGFYDPKTYEPQRFTLNEFQEAWQDGINRHTDPLFWIDHRDRLGHNQPFKELLEDFCKEFNFKKSTDNCMSERVIIKPDNPTKKDVVNVTRSYDGDSICAIYQKDNDFRTIMKDHDFKWENGYWSKKITDYTGDADNLAASIGNALLSSGFTVQFENQHQADMALTGDFIFDNGRHISYYSTDKEFWIGWTKYDSDLYYASIKIPGAHWSGSLTCVPVESYKDVKTFAEVYNFIFSPEAKDIIEEYSQKENSYEEK